MVKIEALSAEHFDRVALWLSKPSVNRWLTADWRQGNVTGTNVAIATRNRRNRLFLVRYNDVPCGLAALADVDLEDRTAMVWYLLGDDDLSGRGITSAAVRKLAEHAFVQLDLACLYAWAMEDNLVSQKVLRNAGFLEVGRIRQSARLSGRQVDRIYFDLLPTEILQEPDIAGLTRRSV